MILVAVLALLAQCLCHMRGSVNLMLLDDNYIAEIELNYSPSPTAETDSLSDAQTLAELVIALPLHANVMALTATFSDGTAIETLALEDSVNFTAPYTRPFSAKIKCTGEYASDKDHHKTKGSVPIVWSAQDLRTAAGFENMLTMHGDISPVTPLKYTINYGDDWEWFGFGASGIVSKIKKRRQAVIRHGGAWVLVRGYVDITTTAHTHTHAAVLVKTEEPPSVIPDHTMDTIVCTDNSAADSLSRLLGANVAVARSLTRDDMREAAVRAAIARRREGWHIDHWLVNGIAHAIVYGLDDDMCDPLGKYPFDELCRGYGLLRVVKTLAGELPGEILAVETCPTTVHDFLALIDHLNFLFASGDETHSNGQYFPSLRDIVRQWVSESAEVMLHIDVAQDEHRRYIVFTQITNEDLTSVPFELSELHVDSPEICVLKDHRFRHMYYNGPLKKGHQEHNAELMTHKISHMDVKHYAMNRQVSYNPERWGANPHEQRLERDAERDSDDDYSLLFAAINSGHRYGFYRVVYALNVIDLKLFKLSSDELLAAAVDTSACIACRLMPASDGLDILMHIAETESYEEILPLVQDMLISLPDANMALRSHMCRVVTRKLRKTIDFSAICSNESLKDESVGEIETATLIYETLLMAGDEEAVKWSQKLFREMIDEGKELEPEFERIVKRAAHVYGHERDFIEASLHEIGWYKKNSFTSIVKKAAKDTKEAFNAASAESFNALIQGASLYLSAFLFDRLGIILWTVMKSVLLSSAEEMYHWWSSHIYHALRPLGVHYECVATIESNPIAIGLLVVSHIILGVWIGLQFVAVKRVKITTRQHTMSLIALNRQRDDWDAARTDPRFWRFGVVAYDHAERRRFANLPDKPS